MLQSSLIVPVPDAESLVAELRQKYDPAAAAGVPAHMTLLYPFRTPPVETPIVTELRILFGRISPLSLRFEETGRFPNTVYLKPEQDAGIIDIINRLVARWPEYPPYGGVYSQIIPHVTIADRIDDAKTLDDIEGQLRAGLPLKTRLSEAWLIASNEHGQWKRHTVFPFGP